MWAKVLLSALAILMIGGALHFRVEPAATPAGSGAVGGHRIRLMTWNIGYAGLEDDTRAHSDDLKAVAKTILDNKPDAVAIQELAGADQLKVLIDQLNGEYRGSTCKPGSADRVEAVLVRDRSPRFGNVPAGDRFAMSATFHPRPELPAIVLVSAHTDAFNAAKRRAFTGEIVDWARQRPADQTVFIAGDLNFELKAANKSNLFTDSLKNDSEAYSYVLRYFRDLGRDAGATALNDRRIDYVFGLQDVVLEQAQVLKEASVGQMDHWPLMVDCRLK